MNSSIRKRLVSVLLSGAMVCSAVSASMTLTKANLSWTVDAADSVVIFSADFEEGENDFTARGTTETLEITSEKAHNGTHSLKIDGREQSWNGPQLALDNLITANTEYVVTAYAMTSWYSNLTLSIQYDDTEGKTIYSNIVTQNNDGSNWSEFSNKISFPSGSTNKYVYFETSDTTVPVYVDDFILAEAPDVEIEDIPSLSETYSGYFKIGTAVTPSTLASKPQMKLVSKHFSGSFTIGNEMKPDYVLDQNATLAYIAETGDDTNPQINLSSCADVLQYCSDNNIPVRGHTLVWHSQTPDWFFKEGFTNEGDWVSKEKMIQRLENYIKNYMEALTTQFPNLDLYAFDVVNEAWEDNGQPRQPGSNNESSGKSAWVQVFGDNSFIEYAFQYAREYAPEGCKLYYNDYNEYISSKTDAICNMALDLKEKGLIDGIGMQSHLDVSFPSASAYRTALEKFAATGLDIQITELDVTTSDTSDQGLEKQAQYYSDIFDVLVDYKDSISAVIFWGVTDDSSWRADRLPLLFHADYTAKPAYYAIIDDVTPLETTATTALTTTTTTTTTSVDDTIPGDVNSDGKLNGIDLSMMRQKLLMWNSYDSTPYEKAMDMNQDQICNLSDAVALLKFLLKQS